MTWREDLSWGKIRASFRGVPFWMEDNEWMPGRRLVVHKVPGKQRAIVQDLGLDADDNEIRAFVFGDDYHLERNALVAELTKGGEGEFVHPFRGVFRVTVVGKPRVFEQKGRLGYAAISFTVIETGKSETFDRPSAKGSADIRAQRAFDAAGRTFAERFSATALDTVSIDALRNAGAAIVAIDREITGALNIVDNGVTQVANLSGAMTRLVGSPVNLVDTIGGAIATTHNAVTAVLETAETTGEFFVSGNFLDQLLRTGIGSDFGSDFQPIATGSETGDRLAQNQDVLILLMRIAFLTNAARMALVTPVENKRQARRARGVFVDAIQDAKLLADDDTYQELAALSAELVAFYDEVAGRLPEVGTFTPPQPMPAVLAAHILYGDARREADIVQRNVPENPNFLEGPLEFLIDAR